jgi:cephalosporin hydroxylase
MKDTRFKERNKKFVKTMSKDMEFKKLSQHWFNTSLKYEYSYHFSWLGLPIIQYPQDIITLQEIIWKVKPDLVIETGVARGGSIIFSASLLELIGKGEVLGIDINIKKENKKFIEKHPLSKRIHLFEGSSVDKKIVNQIKKFVQNKKKILVILDSNHTHAHVLKELKIYSTFVSKNSYLIVFDTIIDELSDEVLKNRPWGKNNNPKSAVKAFLKTNDRFRVDKNIEKKLLMTVAPMGYLKCIKSNKM